MPVNDNSWSTGRNKNSERLVNTASRSHPDDAAAAHISIDCQRDAAIYQDTNILGTVPSCHVAINRQRPGRSGNPVSRRPYVVANYVSVN